MVKALRVVASFVCGADEGRDPHGTPFRQESFKTSKEDALKFIKKLYPWVSVTVEPMEGGLAYYGEFSAGRGMLGNYSFERKELWYKIYPGSPGRVPLPKVPRR